VTGLIGRPILRVEDARLLAGRGHYCDDLVLDGMLHAAILRSDVAHGRLRRIDVTRAMALDGVVDVIAFDEIAPRARPIPIRIGQLPGLERFIQFPLVQDKVRFVGEPIAVVVATSRYLAEDALELIDVDIESLPAVTDWETASAATSLLFENHGTNIASSYRAEAGDVAAAFENADYSRRETFYCHRHTGMPMETRGVVAQWDAAAGRMRVFGAAKIPFPNRRVLAAMLDLPESSIDLIELDVGGGFGVRGEFYPEDFLIPFAARHVGRPVKWIEDRREHLLAANHARDVRCDLEIACRRDGTVLALRGSVFADIGAYARSTGGIPAANAARCLPGPYRIANFQCDVHVFLTNKTPTGTYRGPGMFEANFFSERLLDIAAADLGIDPAEIRRRNLVPAAAMPSARGKLVPYAESETIYDSGDFHSPLNLALAEIGWDKARLAQGRDSDGWYRGVGVACFVASSGVGPKEHARLLLHPDASLELRVGSSTMGQGHETVFAQICAEVLGISPDAIKVLHGSTTLLDNGFGTFHSRAIVMGGSAVFETSKGLIERLRPFAARELGNPNAEMVWRDGAFFAAEGTARVDLGRLAQLATAGGEPLQVDGVFDQTKRTYTYGTHAAIVAVDPGTGKVRLLDYVAVEDIGRAINPLLAHGQAVGGVVQGLGGVFLEHLIYDTSGQALTGSFADYLMPTAPDFPTIRCFCLEEAPSPSNPLGAKGAGEGAVIPVGAVIANAVSAALAPLRVQVRDLPLTAPRVWALIHPAAGKQTSSQRSKDG
jgi:aerobic carbon-monoxide dehydrogenase large subunit